MNLPEKWCIRQDISQKVCDWFNKKYGISAQLKGYFTYLNSKTDGKDYFYSDYIRDGYTEITLEEFERYVLNKNAKFNIQDLSEGKVALEFNKETDNIEDLDKIIKEAFPEDSTIPSTWSWKCKYYTRDYNNKRNWRLSNFNQDLPTQPLKDFLNMKKIIGYKLIKAYPSSEKIGTIVKEFNYPWVDYTEFFEPVYEQEFKIGDICFATNDGANGIGFYTNKTSIVEIVDDSFSKQASGLTNGYNLIVKEFNNDTNNPYRRINSETAKLRKATQKEIDSVTKIMLPNSSYEIKIEEKYAYTNATTKIDNYWFNKEFWEAAKVIAEHTKADVIVGCGAKDRLGSQNQWKLDLTTIQKVLDKLC